jgi:predicted nucleic acid-binding protein
MMMLVVADRSPLIALVKINHADILPALFGQVLIPTQVAAELAHAHHPQLVRDFIAAPPAWLLIRVPTSVLPIPRIHQGEREAISLAIELMADTLIIDDLAGRDAAIALGLTTTRTLAVMAQAADRGLLNLTDAFERLARTDFRVARKVLDMVLHEHLARRKTAT